MAVMWILTIFLCMAMMYPMKGLSCTWMICPLATPLTGGGSGLEGIMVLGAPLGMRMVLSPTCPLAAVPLAVGVVSDEDKSRISHRMKQEWKQISSKAEQRGVAHLSAWASSEKWVNPAQGPQKHKGSRWQTDGPSGCPEGSSEHKVDDGLDTSSTP